MRTRSLCPVAALSLCNAVKMGRAGLSPRKKKGPKAGNLPAAMFTAVRCGLHQGQVVGYEPSSSMRKAALLSFINKTRWARTGPPQAGSTKQYTC